MIKWDGHTHTKFCNHGSNAEQQQYLDRAIQLGFERFSVTEHPPLPIGWLDDQCLMEEIAMPMEQLPDYFDYVLKVKQDYKDRIDVAIGLELDYLPGNNDHTERIVEQWHKQLEDVVVSVHYMQGAGGIRCIDYRADDFEAGIVSYYGTMDAVVHHYFDLIEETIEWASGLPMRKRLGHINLIEKFRKAVPEIDDAVIRSRLDRIVPKLKAAGMGIDANTAGFRVETCGQAYTPEWFIRVCRRQGIPCIFGSDAHRPEHVGANWEWYSNAVLTNPAR